MIPLYTGLDNDDQPSSPVKHICPQVVRVVKESPWEQHHS